jgi:integrase
MRAETEREIDEDDVHDYLVHKRLTSNRSQEQSAWTRYLLNWDWQMFQTISFPYRITSATARTRVQQVVRLIAKLNKTRVYYFWIMKTKGEIDPKTHLHILLFGYPKPLTNPFSANLKTPDMSEPYMLTFNDHFPFRCEHETKWADSLACFYVTTKDNMKFNEGVYEFEDFYNSNPKTLQKYITAKNVDVAPQDRKPLTTLENSVLKALNTQHGGVQMKGSILFNKDRRMWYVSFYWKGRNYKLYRYNGTLLHQTHQDKSKDTGYKNATKLLSLMQSDLERGVFRIEKFTKETPTDVIPYLWEWLEAVKDTLSPATVKDYKNSIKNHLTPFFKANPFQLHEIKYDVLVKLLNSIKREGKGKHNVMSCLRACLTYAYRAEKIPSMPPFPEKKKYNIVDPQIEYVLEDQQEQIIHAIPEIHQPIFWFMKYHIRRNNEARALHKTDYDKSSDSFRIHRAFSNEELVNYTKTHKEHQVPCHEDFKPYMKNMYIDISSPFFFVNPEGTLEGKPYRYEFLRKLWIEACQKVGIKIKLNQGVRHSTCTSLLLEYGISKSELQIATDHADVRSLNKYVAVELQARKRILEHTGKSKILPFKRANEQKE